MEGGMAKDNTNRAMSFTMSSSHENPSIRAYQGEAGFSRKDKCVPFPDPVLIFWTPLKDIFDNAMGKW